MQLNVTTDYAIRIILYLATKGGTIPSRELAEKMGIPQNYVLKIAKRLSDAGYTKSYPGTQGGISVEKSAEKINLLDIIQAMESTTKMNRCLEEDCYCSRYATDSCSVRKFYCILQNDMEEKLSMITIQNLIDTSVV